MNIELGSTHICNAIRPLERLGWRVVMQADDHRTYLMVSSRSSEAMITIRSEHEACLYPPRAGDGLLFEGENAIAEAVAQAIAAAD